MNYNIGVYGDSIAFGYGNNNHSWFEMLSKESDVKNINMAQNGATILDIFNKIRIEKNSFSTLYIAIGINDLLYKGNNYIKRDFNQLIKIYEEIINIAKQKSKKIIIQSVLPVRENLFPNQDWLNEPKYAFNQNIEDFNNKLKKLADNNGVTYINTYDCFCDLSLYIDAVHLNQKGQETLYKALFF